MSRNHLIAALIFCLLSVAAAHPQTSQDPVAQFPSVEPFKLSEGSTFSASASGERRERPVSVRHPITADIEEALDVIRQNHIAGGRQSEADLFRSSIDSMLVMLDPHSGYFNEAEYRDLQNEHRAEYFGVGVTITDHIRGENTGTYVIAVMAGSPAENDGLRFGDRIVAVNGESTENKDSSMVRDRLRGKDGTSVKVTVERAGTGTIETIETRRGRVPQPSIGDHYLLRPGVGYIDMTRGFSYTTSKELQDALVSLRKQNMQALVLDLRGNTGGILEQSVKVAETFLESGKVIVSQSGRSFADNRVWRSSNRTADKSPLVVLVDGSSASASEVVAGALQDHGRALIIGERTFGKGLVQTVLNLPRGAGLVLTTAKYFTPSGRSIQRHYDGGSLYDYYNGRTTAKRAAASPRPAGQSDTGILPDELVKGRSINQHQYYLIDPVFFFVRDNTSSLLSKVEKITDSELAQRFGSFAVQGGWRIDPAVIESEEAYIAERVRYLLALAADGPAAAVRNQIQKDPQVIAAIGSLPRAAELSRASRRQAASAAKHKKAR